MSTNQICLACMHHHGLYNPDLRDIKADDNIYVVCLGVRDIKVDDNIYIVCFYRIFVSNIYVSRCRY